MKIDRKIVIDSNFYNAVDRLALVIEETLNREQKILHTSLSVDNARIYGVVIYQEKE